MTVTHDMRDNKYAGELSLSQTSPAIFTRPLSAVLKSLHDQIHSGYRFVARHIEYFGKNHQ